MRGERGVRIPRGLVRRVRGMWEYKRGQGEIEGFEEG